MTMIRILLADDHALMLEGLRAILSAESDMEIVGVAQDGREAIDVAESLRPDIAIMDIAMPGLNGLEATRLLRTRTPEARVIILSMYDNSEYILQALKAGAYGYLLKQGIKSELLLAIRSVMRGEKFLTSRISSFLIQELLDQTKDVDTTDPLDLLTSREREVLQLICEGHSSQEISEVLTVSPKTVDRHRANIMQKLDIHNLAGLVRFAIRAGMVDISS